ncbi:MAG: hypothetical protein JST87_05300 [Bacteroidetes bacterium]|nr:hypothetical protein [Bacteroidota bacterium]
MPLHHKTKKSAVEKYSHLASKVTELHEALKADENEFTDEEIQELIDAIVPKQQSSQPQFTTKALPRFDKWRGTWVAVKDWVNPGTRQKEVIVWKFEPVEAKPNKTGIPLAQEQADYFNDVRKLRVANAPTEQLYPHGADPKETEILDKLPNPFEAFNS